VIILKTNYRLAEVETKFADLIWEREPIKSPELVKAAKQHLNWSKSTTYTILRRLCERGIFKNENAVVTSVLKKDEFYAKQSKDYVQKTFDGSLPKFFSAFVANGKLNAKQAEELKRLIDEHKEEED
jgi:predicted transcriptional regulator